MAILKFGERDQYMPSWDMMIARHTESELRAEYTRLRIIANARLERMSRSEFADTVVYRSHAGRWPSIKEYGDSDNDRREIAKQLTELADFVSAEGSSVRGLQRIRAAAIESLHEHGYTFVNKKNFKEFADFMDEARAQKISKTYDSERVALMYTLAKKTNMRIKSIERDFERYMQNLEKLKQMARDKNLPMRGDHVNMTQLKKELAPKLKKKKKDGK